jgi:hypothetical protein
VDACSVAGNPINKIIPVIVDKRILLDLLNNIFFMI